MGIRKATTGSPTGTSPKPVAPSKSQKKSGKDGRRTITGSDTQPKIPRQLPELKLTKLSRRTLKLAVSQANQSANTAPLKEWLSSQGIKATNAKAYLLESKLISEDESGQLKVKPLSERKVEKPADNSHDSVMKAAEKAAKNMKSKDQWKKSGGGATKTKPAVSGKNRMKSDQEDASQLSGDSAVVAVNRAKNPLESPNRKDQEEGLDGAKADKVTIHVQKGKD